MSDENTLSPEDLSLLIGLAGPIYAESRRIESYSSDNPVHGGMINDGSMKIKMGLEQMQRQVAQAPRPPMSQMHQPQVEQVYLPPPTIVQYVHTPQDVTPSIPSVPVDQFEFNFNISEQKKTNDLLEVISKKLTKMIGMLESKKKSDDLIKLIPKL